MMWGEAQSFMSCIFCNTLYNFGRVVIFSCLHIVQSSARKIFSEQQYPYFLANQYIVVSSILILGKSRRFQSDKVHCHYNQRSLRNICT